MDISALNDIYDENWDSWSWDEDDDENLDEEDSSLTRSRTESQYPDKIDQFGLVAMIHMMILIKWQIILDLISCLEVDTDIQ